MIGYPALASTDRGDAPNADTASHEDRLGEWCAACRAHMVRKAGDTCPCCCEEATP